jgi:hypothetical protein
VNPDPAVPDDRAARSCARGDPRRRRHGRAGADSSRTTRAGTAGSAGRAWPGAQSADPRRGVHRSAPVGAHRSVLEGRRPRISAHPRAQRRRARRALWRGQVGPQHAPLGPDGRTTARGARALARAHDLRPRRRSRLRRSRCARWR